jgi:hypothetical protein
MGSTKYISYFSLTKEAELASETVFLTKNDGMKNFQHILAYMLKARTVKPTKTAPAMEQIRNTQQWSNWEAVFSTWSMR